MFLTEYQHLRVLIKLSSDFLAQITRENMLYMRRELLQQERKRLRYFFNWGLPKLWKQCLPSTRRTSL